jgi:glycogen(starch) synthase
MHVLITSDTVGGVWSYTQELVTGLVHSGHRITLVSFGKLPLPHQTAWMRTLPGVDYRPTEYRLEWMEVAERDIEESKRYLELLVEEVQPDVLHLSQYCYGNISAQIPKIVVAHSDVVSWWVAVHGKEPDETPWMRNYREMVTNGLLGADVVVAPSQWMLDQVSKYYSVPAIRHVVYNGRTSALFDPDQSKDDFVLSVGRLWDPAKQVSLLLEPRLLNFARPPSICIVGWEREPGKAGADAVTVVSDNVHLVGARSQAELRVLYASAGIYAATSRYEPFGLSPLEAALSKCALVLNDNPVFHELWGDAGLYFKKDDAEDLARLINELRNAPELRNQYGERAYEVALEKFSAISMVEQYERIYQGVAAVARIA